MSETHPRITVLMGGPDGEHDVSLASGRSVAAALIESGFDHVIEHVIEKRPLERIDDIPGNVLFPVLHGPWGEGGPLQRLLESDGRPFVGCGSTAAAAAMDKHTTKLLARELHIATPDWQLLHAVDACTLQPPVVIKPVAEGSSLDLHIADTIAERDAAIAQMRTHEESVLVETFIKGRELTVGIVDGRPLTIIEIKAASGLYDYEAKYQRDDTHYVVGPVLENGIEEMLKDAAVRIYEGLKARHLARVDFLLTEEGPWLLEVNTMPGFTKQSLLPKAAAASGMTMPALCRSLVEMASADAAAG
ncbi:MAG: D-alanine--D-alanine ligase [Phycisphaerales bacterium]|nr:D-alanine--D-alanine ligase [Phycisphaerales bacterium]|tara:strand:+ start:1437 stop:2348 length:912 start_codon:yes stop_codon:yes gene_type:complete